MLKRSLLTCPLLLLGQLCVIAQVKDLPVEVVATASAFVPRTLTFSSPGHSFTDCSGSTSYFGQFSGSTMSGTADTSAACSSTWQPPSTSTLTFYRQYNYAVLKADRALYLVACNPRTAAQGFLHGLRAVAAGAAAGAGGTPPSSSSIEPDYHAEKCVQSFGIGSKYLLSLDKSYVLLADAAGSGSPIKLDYVSGVTLIEQALASPSTAPQSGSDTARVHITSVPSGGEISIDGKFYGDTPSDITLLAGEHAVKVTLGGREWSRTVQITGGQVSLNAELPLAK